MDAIREDRLGRAITWSLGGHGAIALFIILKSLVFPGNPILIAPSLRVDLVGLPDLLKKDLPSVSKTLPKSDLQEKLEEAANAAKKIKPAPLEEVAKPEEMVLDPKKIDKKKATAEEDKSDEKKKAKETAKKIDTALAKIRALDRLNDKSDETPDDDAIVIKGNQLSKGTSLSGNARENAQAGYYDLVREALVEFWALPPWLGRQKLAAQIQIRIDSAGHVLSSKFVKSSGNPQFDEAILGTIREAQPLPKPPKDLMSSLSDDGVVVGFPL
jgi:colicin import membrane protein